MTWGYSADRLRILAVTTRGTTTRTQHLVHPDARGGLLFEREVTAVGGTTTQIENRHYITVPGAGVIGVVKTLGDNNGTAPSTAAGVTTAVAQQTQYWHKDALGSIVAVTDARGALVERMAFDAWGRRMQPSGQAEGGTLAAGTLLNPAHGDRGFTGHEMLDELGLVHMNGRIYDPVLGRFFSPDPVVQATELLQNYNRYSYVLNRPTALTDPSGEFWQIPVFIIGAILASEGNKYWKMVGQLMMMAALSGGGGEPGLIQTATNGAIQSGTAASSFLSASISTTIATGDVAAGVQSGLFAAAFTMVGTDSAFGDVGALTKERVLAHAMIGCVQGASTGGDCGPSAIAAAFGKVTSHAVGDGFTPAQFLATAIAGGTASVIGGGKFSNGASQAAFGYLYNALAALARLAAVGTAYARETAKNQVALYKKHGKLAADAAKVINDVERMNPDDLMRRRLTAGEKLAVEEAPYLQRAFLGTAVHREVADRLGAMGWSYKSSWGPDFTHRGTGLKLELTTSNPVTYFAHIGKYGGKVLVLPYETPGK